MLLQSVGLMEVDGSSFHRPTQHGEKTTTPFPNTISYSIIVTSFDRNLRISTYMPKQAWRVAHLHSRSKPRVFPRSGWVIIDPSIPIEEESIPTYRPEKFYPVYIGEVFNDRYQVVGKLGYGSSTTVWLGRDLLQDQPISIVWMQTNNMSGITAT